ncbi:MAG: PAS domain-containing protein [Anaerolineae bacterium]|nr:PAS domain-containing protein [Anaerolineae bacterium]
MKALNSLPLQTSQNPESALWRSFVELLLRAIPQAERAELYFPSASQGELLPCVEKEAPPLRLSTTTLSEPSLLTQDEQIRRLALPWPAEALLLIPLWASGEFWGLLCLGSSSSSSFTEDTLQRVSPWASLLAWAVQQLSSRAACQQSESSLAAVVEHIPEGIIVLDREERITQVNATLLQMLELPTKGFSLPCPVQEHPLLALLVNPSGGTIVGAYDLELELPSQRRITLQILPATLPQEGRVFVIRDLTQERQALVSRALFISQVSHELRTPLQHILGFLNLLTDLELSKEERTRFLEHIEDETYQMARLIDDLAALSRIEMGRFTIHKERVQLAELIASIVDRHRSRAQLKELTLHLHLPNQPVWISTDPLRVEQVLGNLLGNAFKFAPPGSSVDVSLECTKEAAIIHVADAGPGIEPETLPHIFEPFFQAEAGKKSRTGMGLGLYICQQIVHALGGKIWVESEPGKGSVFSFQLPLLQED